MKLRCPKCKGKRILYSGMTLSDTGGYGATDQKYLCKDCGYAGSLILDTSKEKKESKKYRKLPITWVLVLAFIAVISVSLNEDAKTAVLFFVILSSILIIFFRIIKQDVNIPVEEDLKKLDDLGNPK